MNYTLNQLRIYIAVAQTRSVTKAAELLHLTQPAVSIQLKNFQEQFDVPLFEVVNKKVFITDFGADIAIAAENILEQVHQIDSKINAYKGELVGKLKISSVSTGKYVAPYILTDFLTKHKGVELLLDVTNKAQVMNHLENNLVDFCLVSVLPTSFQIDKIELMPNKLFCVGNENQFNSKKEITIKSLEQMPFIFREQGSGTRLMMEEYFKKHKLKVVKKMELSTNETVKQAVIAGLGYSIMPLIGLKNELLEQQLSIIPVKGFPLKSSWYLIWLKGKKLSPLAEIFVQFLKQEKHNIIQKHFEWCNQY